MVYTNSPSGGSAPSYTWSAGARSGETTNVNRTHNLPETDRTSAVSTVRSSLQTLPWPFHRRGASSTVESNFDMSITRPTRTASKNRRSFNWGFRPGTSASVDNSIIPDYIRNFLRGETPESMARKRATQRDGGSPTHRRNQTGLVIPTDATPHPSLMFFSSPPYTNDERGFSADDDEARMLGSGRWRREYRQPVSGPSGGRRMFTAGWRAGVALNALMSFVILLMALLGLIVALQASWVPEDWRATGDSVVFAGSCAKADQIGWGTLATANLFAVAVVAAANYACQVLSSPTRQELDEAHGGWRWLDIGIPSVRNLGTIAGWRVAVIGAMMLAALCTQVIYNTIMSIARDAVAADILFVTSDFLDGATFRNDSAANAAGLSTSEITALQNTASGSSVFLTTMVPSECLDAFAQPFQIDYDAVFVVVDRPDTTNSLLATLPDGSTLTEFGNGSGGMALNSSTVDRCVASKANTGLGGPSCRVTMNIPLLATVAALNLVAAITFMLVVTQSSRFEPLVSLGDALGSFLDSPDQTTTGACLLDKGDVRQGRWQLREPKHWTPKQLRWVHTVSLRRWLLWGLLWVIPTVLAAFGLATMLVRDETTLKPFGNSSLTGANLFPFEAGTSRSVLAALAALPHIVLAALYLATNAHITTYFVSHELSLYASAAVPSNDGEKPTGVPLRITSGLRVGAQTTSVHLSLPKVWSWLLIVLFATAGFLLSQALVVVTTIDPTGRDPSMSSESKSSSGTISALAILPSALVGLLATLVVILFVVLALGMRSVGTVPANEYAADSANPLVLRGGTCSAAISARAHPHPGEPELAGKRIAWGVVSEGEVACSSHASFSATGVAVLPPGRNYA